jgi:hypothetical protein
MWRTHSSTKLNSKKFGSIKQDGQSSKKIMNWMKKLFVNRDTSTVLSALKVCITLRRQSMKWVELMSKITRLGKKNKLKNRSRSIQLSLLIKLQLMRLSRNGKMIIWRVKL